MCEKFETTDREESCWNPKEIPKRMGVLEWFYEKCKEKEKEG